MAKCLLVAWELLKKGWFMLLSGAFSLLSAYTQAPYSPPATETITANQAKSVGFPYIS